MVILICEKVPESLRGELSRWMIEPKTNVFVGRMSALVRDKLWQRVQEKLKGGAAILAYPTNTEQGFTIKSCGETTRELVNYDGLMLIKVPTPTSKARKDRIETSEPSDIKYPELLNPSVEMRKMLVKAGENPEMW
jgi:CRISPR-associated protein Cas2